jgi:hypothetical protein
MSLLCSFLNFVLIVAIDRRILQLETSESLKNKVQPTITSSDYYFS